MTDIATPLTYLVNKKRRRESERTLVQAHESHQITGTRYAELIERFGGLGDGDGALVDAGGDTIRRRSETPDTLVSLWHVHGK